MTGYFFLLDSLPPPGGRKRRRAAGRTWTHTAIDIRSQVRMLLSFQRPCRHAERDSFEEAGPSPAPKGALSGRPASIAPARLPGQIADDKRQPPTREGDACGSVGHRRDGRRRHRTGGPAPRPTSPPRCGRASTRRTSALRGRRAGDLTPVRRRSARRSGSDLHADHPFARAVVEVQQDDLLPGAERELAGDDGIDSDGPMSAARRWAWALLSPLRRLCS